MEVDISGVLELLDESLMGRGGSLSEVVRDDEEKPLSGMYHVLRSELK